jgi:hypothetical protein
MDAVKLVRATKTLGIDVGSKGSVIPQWQQNIEDDIAIFIHRSYHAVNVIPVKFEGIEEVQYVPIDSLEEVK